MESQDTLRDDPMKCSSLNSTLRTTLARPHVSDTDWYPSLGGDFECNGDLDEAAGAADAIACSGGGSLFGMMQELDCRIGS